MERSYVKDIGEKDSGKSVVLKGWIQEVRNVGKIKFILLRDITGVLQCVVADKSLLNKVPSIESVIVVVGKIKSSKVKSDDVTKKDIEVEVEKIELLGEADVLPISVTEKTITTGLANRLDYRFIDLRKRNISAIFKIQNEIAHAFREHFYKLGYFEMQPPCIISAASEGGTELFPVQYFEKKAFLAQSPQLYKQMIACSMEKTAMITPVWRAEKHNTPRHINEIRQMDIEMAFANQMEIMNVLEGVVKYIVGEVMKNCKSELEMLGVKLKAPKGVYLSYEEAIKKVGGKIGEDFTPEQERKLCDLYPGDIVFTHSWPTSIKPFYIMPKDGKKDAKLSEGFDALYGGVEISSGGQRIHLPELLIERIKAKGLNPKNFKEYIDSFRFGAPPHAGWSIGLERLTQVICGLDNIKEATMFPRDRDRLTP